jgi:tryptophan synthase beta chain
MDNYFKSYPDEKGNFEEYGGSYIPPQLQVEMDRITDAYFSISKSHEFISELRISEPTFRETDSRLLRPDALDLYGGRIYLKREDLNHTAPTSSTTAWARLFLQSIWERRS